jgi:CDP-diglyceride synthetase
LLFLALITLLLFTENIKAIHEMKTILSGCLYISIPIGFFVLLPQMGNLTPADHLNYWNWQQHIGWPWQDSSQLVPTAGNEFMGDYPKYHWQYPLAVFVLIWSSDTFAYLVGKSIGRHPLHAVLSPKKTWEGFIGGTILTAAVACALFHFWGLGELTTAALIGACFSIFGTAGDLFESALKRDKNVKDSGSFIPGHGGALDRFDAFLFGCVVFWAWLNLIA